MHQDEMRGIKGYLEGRLELPEPQVFQVEIVVALMFHEEFAHVDEVIHTICPVPFEIMWENAL
jgi:hypothetical protein